MQPGAAPNNWLRAVLLVVLAILGSEMCCAGLPKRLVLAVDGVPFRDMQALQQGITYRNSKNRIVRCHAFHRGYFPATRVISTYPSASDVAWTDVFGGKPLPGYQRTYFNKAANRKIVQNGVTTTMEYEHEMDWQEQGSFHRTMGYVRPLEAFKREVRQLARNFLSATNHHDDTFYVLMRSTDDAQHLAGDILELMCALDRKLEEIRAEYRAREGRELELVIMSDHGNNHAGAGSRVEVGKFLKRAGFNIAKSIHGPEDVVLPTAGIESWVEIHNHPDSTERLVELLSHLNGVDVVTGRIESPAEKFIVMNSKGERAEVYANIARGRYRYHPCDGDPLGYIPVLKSLAAQSVVLPDGVVDQQVWLKATAAHRYPAAPQRIALGHTLASQNTASIIISLDNKFVHSAYVIKKGSEFVKFGGTHGALDDLNCAGMLVNNIRPVEDTLTRHIAGLFEGFPGRRDYRAVENGAEWLRSGPAGRARLRVWSPALAELGDNASIDVVVQKAGMFARSRTWAGTIDLTSAGESLVPFMETSTHARKTCVRCCTLPDDFILEPQSEYRATVIITGGRKAQKCNVEFGTDSRGLPVGY